MDFLQIRRLGIDRTTIPTNSCRITKINDLSIINCLKHCSTSEHRGLSGTGGPDDTQDFSFIHMNGYILQDFLPIEAFLNMVHFQ